MKRLPKMLCALILCALMVTAAVSCGQKPAQQPQDPPQQEDPQPAPELKIAVDSDPARSAVIHWFLFGGGAGPVRGHGSGRRDLLGGPPGYRPGAEAGEL